MKEDACSQCETPGKTTNLYGYVFCERCASKLRLHADNTILKNADTYRGKQESYEADVIHRLTSLEKSFIQTRVKLLHILERLGELT